MPKSLSILMRLTFVFSVLMSLAQAAHADSPFTGFWGDSTAKPQSGSHDDRMPSIIVPDAGKATIIIYLHGTTRPQKRERCGKRYNASPRSLLTVGKAPNTHIYFLCSTATDEGSSGSYIYKRVRELDRHLALLKDAGVRPGNIFLAGQSAGGWTSLMAMQNVGKTFNAAILFAPACCGPRHEIDTYPIWRGNIRPQQVDRMLQAKTMRALMFAYKDDAFNRPQELAFLTEAYPNGVKMIAYNCSKGHSTHRQDCRQKKTETLIRDYIAARKADF